MRISIRLAISLALVLGTFAISHSAYATNARQALAACKEGCTAEVASVGSDIYTTLHVGGAVISCKNDLPCTAFRTAPKKGKYGADVATQPNGSTGGHDGGGGGKGLGGGKGDGKGGGKGKGSP